MKSLIKNNKVFLLPILSGVLLVLAFPPFDLWFLVFVALIPLFFVKSFWQGWLSGVIFFGILFSWLFATYPFEWLSVSTSKTEILVLLVIFYILQTVFLGLFFGGFAWLLKLNFNRLSKFNFLILVPALWVLLEYLRAWGFGVFWVGKESLLGPHWTIGNLAYALHNQTALIQIADLGGIYLISFLIVLVNVGVFLILRGNWKVLIVLVLILVIWGNYGNSYESNKTSRVALLQTNYASGNQKEAFNEVVNLFKTDKTADILIAPEGFDFISPEIAKHILKDSYKIYLSSKENTLLYYDLEKEKPLGTHDKLLLVPNGDYLPYITKLFISSKDNLYNKGAKIEPINKIGGTICSSIVSPDIQRKMTKNGAEFLAVVSSDAPFHGSKSLLAQNLAMSKLRAVENRRYFAQATNMGYSFLLDPNGQITTRGDELGNKILFADISLIKNKTIYTRFGDWIILLSTVYLLCILWYSNKGRL